MTDMTDETTQPIRTPDEGDNAPETVDVVGATDATPEAGEPVAVSVERVELTVSNPENEPVEVEPISVETVELASASVEHEAVAVEPVSVETVELPTTRARRAAGVRNEPVPDDDALASPAPVVTTRRTSGPTRKERPVSAAPLVAMPPSGPYAVIETGGKQYRVRVGDAVSVERLAVDAGSDLTIDRVLLLGGNGATRVGTPVVSGATVTARIDDHVRGEKIVVFKYKAKKRYRRKMGHRQSLTKMTITAISG
jgi:large subunit ribosomal protein L21